MHFFDFLSSSPKLFIFQKETAKTNFGGILFCLYIIIMISISLAYIINYAIHDKYTFEIKKIDNTTNNEIPLSEGNKQLPYEELDKDEELNPLLNITINAWGRFRIYDRSYEKYLEGDCTDEDESDYLYNITRRVSQGLNRNDYGLEEGLKFHYICGNDSNCSSIDTEIDFGGFLFWYTGYKLDHQADIPFQIDRDELYIFPKNFDTIALDKILIIEFDWEVIQYKDKQSIFDSLMNNKKEITTFGHFKPEFKHFETEIIHKEKYIKYKKDDKGNKIYYMNFLTLYFNNNHFEYILYERTKIEILDILASIGALFSTIKFFF